MTMAYVRNSGPAGDDPKLTFECAGAHCTLVQMSSGQGDTYGFSHPSLGKEDATRVAVIRAVLVRPR